MKMRRFFGALLMLVFALTVVGCVSNKKYNDVAEQLNNAQTQLDAANAQLTVLEEQKAALELQQQNLNAEKAALNARIAQLEEFEGLSAELEEELAQLNEEKEALDARIAETEADLAALQELVAALSNRPVAPTSLELFLIGSTLVGTSTNAAEPDIDYVVTPAGAYTGLYFEVENPEIASVDSLGRVTGLKPGKTKINAWSTLDPSVKDSVDFEVIEAGADLDIVIAAVNEIYAQLNRSYVAEDLALMHASNPSVKISYLKGSEVIAEYVDGELTRGTGYYAYEAPAVDKLEKVTIKGEYGANNVQHNMELTLFVVADLANNAFNRVQMARDIVESYLLPYTSEVEKVSADLALEAEIAGVEIVYTSSAKQVISNEGAYVRPLDDTKVNFQVMYKYQIPGGELYTESAAYDVYANGYTADEKMDYIVNEGSLAFLNGYASNVNINLPAADDKFDAKLTYVSDKPEVFDNAGKYANQELAEATVVTYTVSFEYLGEVLGTREVAVTANLPSVASKAANAFANNNEVPAHFPYGVKGRAGGNALPGLVATQAVGEDTANVAWEALEPELWADGFVLNAQYLRYRETALKATFTNAADETDKAELELVINIGAGKTKDDIIVAGRFSQQTSTVYKEKCDTLALFSYFDPVVGVLNMAFPTYYSGYMFSIQGEFRQAPNNPDIEIFYQGEDASRSNLYIRHDSVIYVTGKKDNGEGEFDNSTLRDAGTGGNWPVLYVNYYNETVLVPFAVHVTGNGSDGEPIVSTGFQREGDLTVDGYRTCFIVNLETGEVVSGNGKGGLQFIYPAGTKYIELPANHAIYCPRTQSNNAIYNGVFCVQGTHLEVNHHDLHPKNSYFIDTANAQLENAEASIAKLEAGEALGEEDANPVTALATANARANNARLSDAEKAGFNAAKYAELAGRYALLFNEELQALKDSKGEIGFYMEDYVVALQAAYDKYDALPEAAQDAVPLKAWLLAEKALYLDANWTITYHLNGGSMYTNEKAKITDLFFSALYQHLLENGFNDWVSQKHNAAGEVVEENVTHTLPSLEVFKDSSADNPHPDAFINLMKGDHGGYGVTTQTKDPDHFALVWLYKLYKEIDGTINADYRALSVGEKRFFNNAKNAHWASLLDIMSETYLAGSAYANYSVPRDLFNGTDLPVSQFFADGGTEFKYAEDRICYNTDKLASTATIKNWWGSYRHITQYLFNFNLSSGNANDLALYPKDTHVIPEAEAAAQLNDGVTNIYNAATVNFAEPVLVKPYSVFEGWYLDAELTQPVVWTVEGLGSVDVDVYAKFSGDPAHTNDVTIKSNPEVVVAVPYGDKLAVPAIPAPEGQVFIGLYEDEDLNVAYDLNAGVYGPKTLYPKYAAVADVYVVKFVTNVEGVQAPDQIFEASAPEKKAVAPAIQNPGFELLGWYKEAEFENLYNFEDEVVANMTLYAKWAQSIEVSFDAGLFGYAIPSQTLLPGEKAVEPEVDYEGYSVEGWYTEKAFENKFDFDVAPEANVKLYAKLVINAHTIKFTDRGEELAPFAGNYGAAIVFPADPVKEYYDFIGWYYENEEGDEVKFTALAMPDADYDLYSKFAATKYTISLEAPNYGLYGPDRETLIVDLLTEYHEFLGRTDSLSDFMHGAGNTTGYQGPWKGVKKFYKANSRYVDDSLGVFVSDARYFDKWVPFFDHIDALVTQINHQQSMWGSEWTGNIRLNDWICGTGTNMGAEPYVSMLPMVPAEIEYTVEDAVELPKISLSVPASTATFAGWYQLVEDELVKVLSFPVGTTGDMTLHAVFLSPEFEVQYYDGSTLLEKELLGVGQTISLVAPEKENAVFQGWFLDPALTEAYDASAVVAADLVLYAKFQPVTTTLTYEVNGGSAMAPDTGAYGREVPAPAAPTKIGYEFGGFFADAACTEAFVFPVASLEADATVYVKWIAKDPLTVSFDVISGTVIVSVTVEYGTELAKPEQDPAYEGRIFQGWFADAPCTEEFVFPVVVTEDVTIYAKWEMIQTKITYVENGGSEVADDTGDWGRIVAEPVITREGYTLDGWYEDELCTELHSFYQPVTEDIILYAKWSAIPIKVSFDAQGGTPVNPEDLDPIDTFYDELIAEPQGLTYENKVLEGWYTEDTFPAEKKFNFAQPIKETANFTLYAHWVPAPRTVTFNTLAEGVVVAPVVVPHGELLVAPTDPERYGYTFSAWFIDEALSTPYNFANPVVADMTLYAQWTVKQYDITFNDQYLSILTVVAEHDTYLTPPIVSPRTGFTFDGWFKDMEGSPDQEWKFAEDKVTEEMTLYGKWSIIQITLSFDSQGGSDVADMVQDYNTAFPAPADPTREGYTFEGWYEEPACTNLYDFETKLIADKELYAKWEVIPLTFTFNYDAIGEAAVDVATEYWAVIAEPAEGDHYPTPVGKTFEGYYVDALYSEAYDFTQQLKADTEVFAKYDIEQITLSFDSQGGSAVAPITQDYNTAFPEPEDPTWVGMVFEGWYEEPGCVNLYDFATLLTADKVLYADWSIQQTELSFNTTGGDPKAAMSGDYGRFIDAADVTDPTRAGHDFKGWYEELDLINPVTFPIEMTADKVIYAKWEIQMKKLTFNSNGGTVIADVIVPYGTVVVRPYDPERHHPTEPDYIFVDWYRVPVPADCQLDTEKYDFTQPLLADTIIYAHWHPDLTAWNTMLNELPEWADDNAAGTYTAMSWAAYKAKIELLEVEHLTYEAMEPLFAVVRGYRDDLFEPSEGASTPEQLAALLADPGVTEITLSGGPFTDPIVIDHDVTILGGNSGHAPGAWDPANTTVITGGITVAGGDVSVTIDGVQVEKENIEAVTDGDITIKNTVIENLTDPADPAISIDAGGVITIESVQIDGAMASDNTTTGILILCDETDIVIKNVTIEAVKGDAIKIVGSASLQSLVIQDNRIEFWDIDLDATEGGRAIDIQFNNDALFNASIIGNKFTAPAYGSEEPKDKEIILLSNVQKIGNVEFVGNTFSYTHPLHHPLSIDIDGDGTAEEYGYVSRDAGATYTLEVIKDLAAAEFNTGVIVAGYLPDGDASVYNEWVALPGDSNQYTPLTWAAYQTFVDNQGIDAESTGKEIYDATLALPVEQAKLIKKISSAHDDASLAPLLADPGVEQINLAAGNYTIVVAPAGPVIISGPNAGLAGTDAGRAAEAVLQGGVQSSHALTLDGVKVIDNGIYAKGTGNVAIQCTVIDDISVPSTDPLSGGDTIAIAFWNTGAANVDQVKITNVISTDPDSEGMGIKVNQGVTSLVVLNSHIETTDHNSINVHVSGTLTKLDILGNYLADWDCDEDDEGGRAIRIEYAGANGFVSNFIGNQIIARDFTGIPVDKEFIKLTNIKQLASVAFVNNTITDLDPTDGQWILSSGAEPIAIQDYGYVAKGAGAFELVKIKELTAADFAGAEVRLVGYLPDGDLSVFTPLAEEVYPLSQYTQSTADAYEAFVNGIDAESTGEEIYAATLALPTEQAKLIKKISPAANDAELVVLLANPEVEGVILAEGQTYNTAIDVDRKFAVYGPNQGTSGLSTERKPEALLLGGIGTYGGGLVVDGVKLETYGIYAKLQGVGDVEIRNTIINDVTTAHADEHYATISGIYLRNQGRVTIDAVKITNINHHRANNGITLGSYNPGAATDIVIQNCHIENVSHNSITVSTSTSISKIEIINNKLINWNSDMDADVGDSKEGGRALRLSVQSTLQPPFVLKVQGNTMTAPDYEAAGAHITDEEFIKINGTAKLTSVLFENNTISEPVAGLYILGLAPEAGPNKAYAYLKNPDDSYSFVRTDAFDELDFLGALEFVGYLPDAELAVYNAVLGQVNELDYTPASWAAYQIVVNANEVDATNNGKEIFDATHAIALAQEDLVLKVSSAADDAELAALLADPEVEEVILAGGVEYSAPIAPPAGNNTNISGPNKGKAYNDPDRVEEAVMSGGIITTGAGDLTIDGVKIEGSGVHAKGTGNVTIQNTIIDGVDNAHSTGEAIGIETWSAGTVLIDGVKITNISDTGSEFGMGIRIREGATDVIIRNSYIDGVTHNAINVYSCNSLTSLLIDNNTIKNWDSDMDTTEGGRAIRVSLTNAGAIPIIISNNVFEAPLYDAAFIPVDKEYIKITNITRASEVTLENNVMSAPIAAQWILSLGIGNTAPDANNTLSINGGAPASVDTKTLAESDFLDKLVFTP